MGGVEYTHLFILSFISASLAGKTFLGSGDWFAI
jgi:hypothetical protein